ncbi:MAG: TetR/AcrR family transcriptional regulator [Eubacterium sp.]|nr:TetR/AcrR family transcriptional regulator [Eubacterium sp.]
MYEKGVQTRNLIYNTAKQLFYDKGFEKTKIKAIVEASDVPIGLFTYYFKTKDRVVQRIYSDFHTRISLRITESNIQGADNAILRHVVLSWIYYDIILSDPNNSRFYYEILSKTSNYRYIVKFANQVYRRYTEEFNVYLTDREFDNILFLDFGGRREFFLQYFEKQEKESVDEIIFLINGIVPRMMGIDQNTVTKLLYQGVATAKTIPHDDIRFLI